MVNENPTVSVILPTYNRAHLVGRAIQSILNQTYQDFEIIIIDDGSIDNTEEVIKGYINTRIKYVRHHENKGGSAARNTGIKLAKGKYIAFQDSDDEWLPKKLEKQMNVFVNASPEVGMIYTDMWRVKGTKKKYFHSPKIMPDDKIIYERALDYCLLGIGIQSALIKKESFNKVGMFDEKFQRLIDLEFFVRLSKYYYFYHIAEPLVNFFDADKGISSNAETLITARKLILEKYFEDIKKNNKVLAKHFLCIGASLCMNGKLDEGKAYFTKVLKVHPHLPKDQKSLSKKCFYAGVVLCEYGDFRTGKNYIIKAAKINPLNIKFSLAALSAFFGPYAYKSSVKIYLKLSGE